MSFFPGLLNGTAGAGLDVQEKTALVVGRKILADVATIKVAGKQNVLSDFRHGYCERLSFSPWNGVAEQRPMGAINRLRLPVYSGVSNKRRTENQVDLKESEGVDEDYRTFLSTNGF